MPSKRPSQPEPSRRSTPPHLHHSHRAGWLAGLVTLAVGSAGCSGSRATPEAVDRPPHAAPTPTGPATAPAPVGVATATTSADAAAPPAGEPGRCGALDCWLFATPQQAFRYVLETEPTILAVGESHARRDMAAIPSTTKRFTEQLLRELPDRTTDLVLELWVADGACGEQEQQVAKQQEQVTKDQAESNTNEFVLLGRAAKQRGMIPHVLRPSCEEYRTIAGAGQDAPLEMLTMITKLTVRMVEELLDRRRRPATGRPPTDDPLIVAYGGGMHNDLRPRPNREQWSFGPELHRAVSGRYVELDLIVPEFIRDSETWKALPWYDHFDPQRAPERTTLIRQSPGSYVLIFPRTG